MPLNSRRAFAVFAALILPLGLASCGSSDPVDTAPDAGYPVVIDNCGTKVTFDSAPQRVVTIKSTSTEMLLALGLADRIVGQAFSDGPVPEKWAKSAADVPKLSDKLPSQEVVLAEEPDLVYAGWESNLTAEGAGDRERWQTLGVNTLVSPAACKEKGYKPDPMTFDKLFEEIEQVGEIFDADKAATTLVDEQRRQLTAVRKATEGTSAVWYSSGIDIPYVGAGIGTPQMIMEALGLDNIASGVKDTWTSMSWEKVVAANPDVIVLVDARWNSAKQKIALLEKDPATRRLDAVVNRRYLTIDFPASEAGVRTVPATVDLSTQLEQLEGADG